MITHNYIQIHPVSQNSFGPTLLAQNSFGPILVASVVEASISL